MVLPRSPPRTSTPTCTPTWRSRTAARATSRCCSAGRRRLRRPGELHGRPDTRFRRRRLSQRRHAARPSGGELRVRRCLDPPGPRWRRLHRPHDLPGRQWASSVATGEFNSDADLDLVVADGGGNSWTRPSCSATATAPSAIRRHRGRALARSCRGRRLRRRHECRPGVRRWFFFDGAASIVPGDGDGAFDSRTEYEFGSAATSLAIADFNADSVLDVATTDPDAGVNSNAGVLVLLGPPLARWWARTCSRPSVRPRRRPGTSTPTRCRTWPPPTTSGRGHRAPEHPAAAERRPGVRVAPGGSCGPGGREGTIGLALAGADWRAGRPLVSVTSSNHPLVPTRRMTQAGRGARRTLTSSPAPGAAARRS